MDHFTHSRRSGFTLVELLSTIGLIAVLASMLLPALARAKAKARQVRCLSNQRQIAAALRIYVDESGYYPNWYALPAVRSNCWDWLVAQESSTAVFDCPASGLSPDLNWTMPGRPDFPNRSIGYNAKGTATVSTPDSYGLNGWNGLLKDCQVPGSVIATADYDPTIEKTPGIMLPQFVYDWSLEPRHGGRAVVGFADGHCEAVSFARLESCREKWNVDGLAHQ